MILSSLFIISKDISNYVYNKYSMACEGIGYPIS